jgi:YbgC/YbaW family acyl-CoA thioester hydrolase
MKVVLPIVVLAFETDYGGVVSNTRYPEYLERGRYALMHAAGLKIEGMWAAHGVQPVVRRVEIEYLGFARHEEELELEVETREWGTTSVLLGFTLRRAKGGEAIMRATQTLAFVNTRWRPTRVPPWLLEALERAPIS